jgi:hypothetical protein
MLKRTILFVATVALILICGNVFAAGFGFFGTAQGGDIDWEVEDDFGNKVDFEGDKGGVGFGFIMDTAPGERNLFNYRLEVATEVFDADVEQNQVGFQDTFEMAGIAVDNSFGFGVFRNDAVRLWVGPRVRVGFFGGESKTDSTVDVALIEFGVGGVFGANFRIGPTVSLGLEVGTMITGYAGEIDDSFETLDITGDGPSLFLNGVVLFRTGTDRK